MFKTQDFLDKNKEYLKTQVGNPEGSDKPNKKAGRKVCIAFTVLMNLPPHFQFYDPRVWVREGEKTLVGRVKEACRDLGNVGEYQP
jgi:fructose-bisphosphate aldolase class II